MSLAAARLSRRLASRRVLAAPSIRTYSSHNHDDHHHEEYDSTVYPAESGFFNGFWMKVVAAAAVVGVGLNYAPAASNSLYITKWIGEYVEPEDRVAEKNIKHTVQTKQSSDQRLFFQQCKRPLIQSYKTPHMLSAASPFNSPVGGTVDMSDIKFSSF